MYFVVSHHYGCCVHCTFPWFSIQCLHSFICLLFCALSLHLLLRLLLLYLIANTLIHLLHFCFLDCCYISFCCTWCNIFFLCVFVCVSFCVNVAHLVASWCCTWCSMSMLCLLMHFSVVPLVAACYCINIFLKIFCHSLCFLFIYFFLVLLFLCVIFLKNHLDLLTLFVACLYIFDLSYNNTYGCSYITTIFTL